MWLGIHKKEATWYVLVSLVCLAARLYLLPNIGLVDYDSVQNWQIVQEIGNGNFQNLFISACPSFRLFFSLFTPFFEGVYGYILVNMLFNVGAVLLLIHWLQNYTNLPRLHIFGLGLVFGLSVFMVSTSRNFGTESACMFVFMLTLHRYHDRIVHQNGKALFQAAAWLALSITINYKLLLVIPVFLAIEVCQRDGLLNYKTALQVALILALPFVFYAFVAVSIGLPFYWYPAVIFSITRLANPSETQLLGPFNSDFLYYTRYMLDFEWPLLLFGLLLFPILFRRELFNFANRKLNSIQFIFLVCYLFLGGMHLLVKAPRGLLLFYGLGYAITLLTMHRLLGNRVIISIILLLSIAYQMFTVNKQIYTYSYSNYPRVIAYLKKHNIEKIASTVSLNLVPNASLANIKVKVIFDEQNLPALKAAGFTHVLLDNYYIPANILKFKSLERQKAITSWPEATLLIPLLFLDHAEYNGFTYTQIITLQQKSARDSVQLKLLQIP